MRRRSILLFLILIISLSDGYSQLLQAPPRNEDYPSGSQFAKSILGLDLEVREDTILSHIARGNIPGFLHKMVPVTIADTIYGYPYLLTYYVLADYLSVGSDTNFIRIPMTPQLAQKIASLFNCTLPTTKMVDDIYRIAPAKLSPRPISPSDSMTSVPVFLTHNRMINRQMDSLLQMFPKGTLMAGHKKDIVLTNQLLRKEGRSRVAIYGWHRPDRTPVQPLYIGHFDRWVDYSHGVRLVSNRVVLNGLSKQMIEIFQDPVLSNLVSHEGVVKLVNYPPGP